MLGSQQDAIDLFEEGKDLFISGAAGSGKSWLIHQINEEGETVLAAPTGIAALNIGGETCHSIFGLPAGLVADKDKESIPWFCKAKKLFENGKTELLILEEISMVRADHLDLIDLRLRMICKSDQPFGGVQVVLVGDPFQLPPILTQDEKPIFRRQGYKGPWFFNSHVWREAGFTPIVLEKIYRQENEEHQDVLNKIRCKDDGWEDAVDKINQWAAENSENTGEPSLVLCCYNKDADRINEEMYDKIKSTEVTYEGIKEGKFRPSDCNVDPIIKLKVGCRVIICANDSNGAYKNGQSGEVISMAAGHVEVLIDGHEDTVFVIKKKWERHGYESVRKPYTVIDEKSGEAKTKTKEVTERSVVASFHQIPLKLGWAISIHKSQGLTLDKVKVNLGKETFAPAQTYVALSRVKDLRNITLTRPIRYSDVEVDKKVAKFYKTILEE